MATPEILPQTPQIPEVQHVPEQIPVPEQVAEMGVTATPADPQQLQTLQGQVLAQPVNPPPVQSMQDVPTVVIHAQSEEQLLQMSKGDPKDTATWFGVEWLYRMKKFIQEGKRIIFGQ